MGKKLAIKGHPTRGKEVIELLKMMGGHNGSSLVGDNSNCAYFITDSRNIGCEDTNYILISYFTLEEFLKKYPFKVGDVIRFPNQMLEEIAEMRWDEELGDIIYTSVSGWTRPCQIPKNTNCSSTQRFDKDCPSNTPKSYAVGLKDGKVIDCIANKEIDMNKDKPIFKVGDVVKLKGCSDENLFWIVMDVVKDGYIFNDGKKYSFDDQHHYEKSNRKVINITKETFTPEPDITTNIKENKIYLILKGESYHGNRISYQIPDGYEVSKIENGEIILQKKKPKYPTTYEECCKVIGISRRDVEIDLPQPYQHQMFNLFKLIICRNAYWKIAGEEMGLDGYWEPDWTNEKQISYGLYNELKYSIINPSQFVFPTKEMRDVFYENFKDLIEQCKELL